MDSFSLVVLGKEASFATIFDKNFIDPVVGAMCGLASLICVLILINGGYLYITSSSRPEILTHAKVVIRNALLGLVIVLSASTLTLVLSNAYGKQTENVSSQVPIISSIQPQPAGSGLVDVLIKAITGLLLNIVQSIAVPFMRALNYFTTRTPLMAENNSVFHLWLVMVSISDSLFILVLCLLGFHIMSFATFGLEEIEFKHLLPKLGLAFLFLNVSIFVIDGVIELSNAMIRALQELSPATSVWDTLSGVTKQSGSLGIATLLIMVVFLVLSIILLVFYVGRLVALYTGALLSPLVCLLWLIPSFKDFAEAAVKVYLVTIFVLFVHVVILQLAASIFAGLVVNQPDRSPDPIMAMIIGLATVISLLKTQGLLMQLSYVGLSTRSIRKLGTQFITVMSYASNKEKSLLNPFSRYGSSYGSSSGTFGYQPHIISKSSVGASGDISVGQNYRSSEAGQSYLSEPSTPKKSSSDTSSHKGIEIHTRPVATSSSLKHKLK